jgi:NAD(P)-dependent dehydrogenase (short-subunit alcohol dehydrogenase family)
MTAQFENKVAVVTGASSGIGRASALLFAREGALVVASDIEVESGLQTVEMIKQKGGEAIFIKTDVSKASEVEAMVNKAIDTYGRLDYAHNNAGIMEKSTALTEYPEETFDHIIGINLKGVFLCMKCELAQMTKAARGAIVNTSSMAGLRGISLRPGYAASKHGVAGLTKAAALEYAKTGIRINAICPGATRTGMISGSTEKEREEVSARLAKLQPMGRLGEPEEIAEAVIWLCSDRASFVTGEILSVSGGWAAQ